MKRVIRTGAQDLDVFVMVGCRRSCPGRRREQQQGCHVNDAWLGTVRRGTSVNAPRQGRPTPHVQYSVPAAYPGGGSMFLPPTTTT